MNIERPPEADMKFRSPVILHVLKRLTRKQQSSSVGGADIIQIYQSLDEQEKNEIISWIVPNSNQGPVLTE